MAGYPQSGKYRIQPGSVRRLWVSLEISEDTLGYDQRANTVLPRLTAPGNSDSCTKNQQTL
jgi:hypothetical protein